MSDLHPDLKRLSHEFIEWLKDESSPRNPQTSVDVFNRFGIRDAQTRDMVNWLRSKGDPIVSLIGSDQRGYYWCDNFQDIQPTLAHLRSRIAGIDAAYRGLCRAFRKNEEQAELAL